MAGAQAAVNGQLKDGRFVGDMMWTEKKARIRG